MIIDTLPLGDFLANCHCLRADEQATECLLIDPGLEPEPLVQFLTEKGLTPVLVLLTHGHVDHIGGLETIRAHWPNIRVAVHEADAEMLCDPNANLSILAGTMVQARPADIVLGEETRFVSDLGMRFEVFHTPGHTPGGICLYAAKDGVLFSGDTLFAGSVGRSDFPGGDHEQLIDGIRQKLLTLPEETKVYPGHGPVTTLRNEKKHNMYLR